VTANLVLSGGPTHDFAASSGRLVELLSAEGIESVVEEDLHQGIECLVDPDLVWDMFTVNALRWTMGAERYRHLRDEWAFVLTAGEADAMSAHVRDGGGLLALHTAVICFDTRPAWHETVGASWDWGRSSHPPLGEILVTVTDAGRRHPLTTGLESFSIVDEAYGFLREEPGIVPLLTAEHGGRDHPVLWARPVGAGRVVTDLLGHDASSFAHPTHAEILRRAARWVAGSRPEEQR
jgi:type 1 glutamine amidotransferase